MFFIFLVSKGDVESLSIWSGLLVYVVIYWLEVC